MKDKHSLIPSKSSSSVITKRGEAAPPPGGRLQLLAHETLAEADRSNGTHADKGKADRGKHNVTHARLEAFQRRDDGVNAGVRGRLSGRNNSGRSRSGSNGNGELQGRSGTETAMQFVFHMLFSNDLL